MSFDGEEEEALLPLIDTRAVQRLRRIHQNGAAFLAYHGLERSRFSHALGTYQAGKFFADRIQELSDLYLDAMGPYALTREAVMGFKAACLLHDLGHPCFSHAGERFLRSQRPDLGKETKHESWTLRIVQEDPELQGMLATRDWYEDLRVFIAGERHPLEYLQRFYSGNIDVDRSDYLARDGDACGVGYGFADFQWLLQAMDLELVGPAWGTPRWEVVFDEGRATYAIEQLLLARRSMYAQVYFHKTVRASEALLLALLQRALRIECFEGGGGSEPRVLPAAFGSLASDEPVSVDQYLLLDDTQVLAAVAEWASTAADPILRDLSDSFIRRRLFKAIPLSPAASLRVREADRVERLRDIVDSCGVTTSGLESGERPSDYYLTVDEPEADIYEPGAGSVYLRRQTLQKPPIYPFEAHDRIGRKFSNVGEEGKTLRRTFVIVPPQAKNEIQEEIVTWT